MNKWLSVLLTCFMVHTSLSAAYNEYYAVIDQVQYFEDYYGYSDPESGAWFWLHDGSSWMRTDQAGPIYYLFEGQQVCLVPMTYEEQMLYRLDGSYSYYEPYWIVLDGYNVAVAYHVW